MQIKGSSAFSEQRKKHQQHSFKRAVISVAILTVLVSLILYVFYYTMFARYAKKQMLQSTQSLTESICYSITEMNTSIQNLCVSQISAGDVQYLMHTDVLDSFELNNAIARLKRSIGSNGNIHSLIIYNLGLDWTFSTYRGISNIDLEIKTLLSDPETTPLAPIPRLLNIGDYYSEIPVFSYIMNDVYSVNGTSSSMVVNVTARWLNNSLTEIVPEDSHLIIFDSSYRQLAASDDFDEDFLNPVPDYCQELVQASSSSVLKVNNRKTFASVSRIEGTDWYLLYEIPYNALMKDAHVLEAKLLIFSLIVFSLAIAAAFWVVHNIYKPIKHIAHSLETQVLVPDSIPREDDITYISQTIHFVSQRFQDMQKTTSEILHENLIRSVLQGVRTSSHDAPALQSDIQQFLYDLSECAMVLLRVDNFSTLLALSAEQRRQLNDTMIKVIRSVIPSLGEHGVVNVSPSDYILLFVLPEGSSMQELLSALNSTMQAQCGLSISLFWESKTTSRELHQRFIRLQHISRYRMFVGSNCCIDETLLESKQALPLYYPAELVQEIVNAIKEKDAHEACALYLRFSQEIRENNNYENHRFCVLQLFFSLQILVDEIVSYSISHLQIDMDEIFTAISHSEHIGQIDAIFYPVINNLCNTETPLAKKHSVLLESVKEYVNIHYADKELSLKQIAYAFNLSQPYLGKIFREHFNLSIKDYITQVRLQYAAEYLTQSNYSIKKVMDLSGFENESNFYRVFRASYGVTPSSFRMSHSIQKSKLTDNIPLE